jgi:ankyrin repeat protein
MNERGNDIEPAAEGTCAWLFQHSKYTDWIAQPRELLWIKGNPGAGKSTLLKHILRHSHSIVPTTQNRVLLISFFFHGRGTELQKTPLGLFRAFLYQLLSHAPNTLADLVQTFRKKCETIGQPGEKWNWHPRELQEFFEGSLPKVLERYSVFILVDALDECGEEIAVVLVKDFQYQVQKLVPTGSQFSICFTCRHYPILALDYGSEICVERENEQDIETYVRGELTKDGRSRDQIVDTIISRAFGSFQWVFLVIKRVLELERKGKSIKIIKDEVQRLPQDLNDLYKELFESISQEERPHSLKLMQWIYFAVRPLTLDELRFAMIVDATCPYKSLQMCQNMDEYIEDYEVMERRLKTLSRGLAEVREFNNTPVVQFIHQSVNEFFVRDGMRLLDPSWESSDLAIGSAHYHLSRSCIRYISMDEIVKSEIRNQRNITSKFPFLHYATTSWVVHTVRSESKNISQVDLLRNLDWPLEDLFRLWIDMYQRFDRYSEDCPCGGTTLLHIVARYGLTSLLSATLKDLDDVDVEADSKDEYGQTPLSYAAEGGHETVVRLLVNRNDVEADSKDKCDRTPLSYAAEEGHETVVRLLVNRNDIETDSKDRYGQTPLSYAAERGHETVVRLLVDRNDIEADSKDKDGQTSLSYAARRGHETVVKLLVNRNDVEADSKDKSDRTPLSWAAGEGYETLVKLLVDRNDVETNSKDKYGQTPLSYAAERGHETIVRLLVDRNDVEADSKNGYGQTPLSCAAEGGNETVVKLRMDRNDVDPDSKNKSDRTPLSYATEGGHETIMRLLVDRKDVKADSKNKSDRTPLSYAAERGHEAVMRLLMNRTDIETDSKNKFYRTPLSYAAEEGHETIVKLLVNRNDVEADSKIKSDRTPLSYAAERGHKMVVRLLVNRKDVEVDSKDGYGQTPLSWAAEGGHETVVKLLLENGADVLTANNEKSTPLHAAALNGHEIVVKLLLENGADVQAANDEGWTALHTAAFNAHEAVVKLLLERDGIDPNSEDNDSRTPLLLAAENGLAHMMLMLIESKAYVNSRDERYGSVLQRAVLSGNQLLVQILIEHGVGVTVGVDKLGEALGCIKGYISVVDQLLHLGVNPDKVDEHGWSPLLCAKQFKQKTVLSRLLSAGGSERLFPHAASFPPTSLCETDKSAILELSEHGMVVTYIGKILRNLPTLSSASLV